MVFDLDSNALCQPALALFDLDKTLLPLDSDHAWGEFMVASGWVDERTYRAANDQFYQDYQNACLDPNAYLQFCLAPLTSAPMRVWQQRRDAYIQTVILPLFVSGGLSVAFDAVRHHRDRGDVLVMITATNAFITRPIARMFGFDHLIAVEPCFADGFYLGGFEGDPNFGLGKVSALEAWSKAQMTNLNLSCVQSWFYSDSINDLPLLSRVKNPVVVNGDARLRAHALNHNWVQLDWFT